MKTNTATDEQEPTTFELARLAIEICKLYEPDSEDSRAGMDRAVTHAGQLWAKTDRARRTMEERRDIVRHAIQGLFTMTAQEWRALLDTYPGEQDEFWEAIYTASQPRERVMRELFRDTSLSTTTREKLFLALPGVAIKRGNQRLLWENYPGWLGQRAPAPISIEAIKQPRIDGVLCRWLAEARAQQLAISKKRTFLPQKGHGNHRGKEHSIQYKAKIRA